MDLAIQLCSYLVGLPLEVLIISAMRRGPYKKYPLVFAYVVAYFLTTILEMPWALAYYWDPRNGRAADRYTWWYYNDEVVLQILVFSMVISLIYQATARLQSKRIVRLGLIAGAVLFAGISFLIHYNPDHTLAYGLWATAWLSNLKFCAAVLDLALWALLIGSREKDQRLLMVTCALGIMFAGEAIGESIRNLASAERSHTVAHVGGLLVMLANLGFLYIWWRTFRTAGERAPVRTTV